MCVFCCRPPHSENGVCGPTRAGAISDDAGLSETANPSRAWPFDWKSEDLVPRSSCRFHCAHWGECFVFVACLRRSPESVQVGMTAITATGVYWHGVWIATPSYKFNSAVQEVSARLDAGGSFSGLGDDGGDSGVGCVPKPQLRGDSLLQDGKVTIPLLHRSDIESIGRLILKDSRFALFVGPSGMGKSTAAQLALSGLAPFHKDKPPAVYIKLRKQANFWEHIALAFGVPYGRNSNHCCMVLFYSVFFSFLFCFLCLSSQLHLSQIKIQPPSSSWVRSKLRGFSEGRTASPPLLWCWMTFTTSSWHNAQLPRPSWLLGASQLGCWSSRRKASRS
jgi:hypothetical protein